MDNYSIFSEYFLSRLLINTSAMIILIRFIYYGTYQKRDHFFTFFILNFVVFLLTYLMEKANSFTRMGSAFGLIAAFSLLRFRTESLTIKDMTYLFLIMALGLINSIMNGSYLEIIAINGMIILAVLIVDSNKLMRIQKTKTIEYDSLEHIKPSQNKELINILREKTGLDIQKTTIEDIDFKRNLVVIKIYYF